MPTASQRSGTNCGVANELRSGFGGRQRGGVEPPADRAEVAPHVGVESVIVLELELLVSSARRVSLLAHLHSGRERDEPHRARPSLDEVLALRADRMETVRKVIGDLTDERLAGVTEPVTEPGYPAPESYPVRRCLQAILNEEWEHRLYAERDFDEIKSWQS